MSEPELPVPAAQGRARSHWTTPAGISALAGVASVLVIVVGWFVTGELRKEPETSTPPGGPSLSGQTVPDDQAENLLFVYGSTMPGQPGYTVVDRYVNSTRRDSAEGLLFDSGRGYPLAKFDQGGTIRGYLLELDEETQEDARKALTQYEGGLFHPVEIRTESGATATAYEWLGGTDGFPRIDAWNPSSAEYGQETPVNTRVLGDCFDTTSTPGWGISVDCAAPHQFEVYHRDVFTAELYPGLASLEATASTECSRMFDVHFGRAFDPAKVQWFFPSQASWADGDRALLCAASP
jgi:gamma-glutamylcyclotransferase (GGCT)/AIG2-like uncharacterized protein YtfP